jgi:gamma-glutamyltranspeptidase/glutathione hydrolase
MSTRAFHRATTTAGTFQPRVFGTHGAVVAENYLAAEAGLDVLKAGGNAVDAVVAGVLVEGLVDPHMYTLGGETPMIVKMAGADPLVVNGNTAAPRAATAEEYRRRGYSLVPDTGILSAGVPAAPAALIRALSRFGTFSFETVARAALGHARDGFPGHAGIIEQERYGLRELAPHFLANWPATAALYLPVPKLPCKLYNLALADLLQYLIDAERAASGSRTAKLQQVYEAFYSGEPATLIDSFSRERDGLLTRSDMEAYRAHIEAPVALNFGDARIYKCGPWNQGPVLLQTLGILDQFNLRTFGHNSADYIHHVVEAMNLAFADREQYYGDPGQVAVPMDQLLSADYAQARAGLIDPQRASHELRPGDPANGRALLPPEQRFGARSWGAGTVHVSAMDQFGNMVAATPSGAWIKSNEVVAGLGFPLGNRLMTFRLEPARHPNLIAPCKRPRTTISPTLVTRGNQPWMVLGSMGGDQQDQWQLQFLLNRIVFDLCPQAAIEAAKFSSEHFPASFGSPERFPARLRIEPMAEEVLQGLRERGHDLDVASAWSEGFLLAIEAHAAAGLLEAAADPRGSKTHIFAPAARVF